MDPLVLLGLDMMVLTRGQREEDGNPSDYGALLYPQSLKVSGKSSPWQHTQFPWPFRKCWELLGGSAHSPSSSFLILLSLWPSHHFLFVISQCHKYYLLIFPLSCCSLPSWKMTKAVRKGSPGRWGPPWHLHNLLSISHSLSFRALLSYQEKWAKKAMRRTAGLHWTREYHVHDWKCTRTSILLIWKLCF